MPDLRHAATATALLLLTSIVFACSASEGTAPPSQSNDVGDSDIADVGTDSAEDIDTPPPGPPEVDASPHFITFSGVEIDDSESARITLRNIGESNLTVTSVQLRNFEKADEFELLIDDEPLQDPLTLGPLTAQDIYIEYAPQTAGATRGDIVITSDDPDITETIIRVETISAYGDLEAPERITFGTVAPGSNETERVEIYNRGLYPLRIHSVSVGEDSVNPDAFYAELVGNSGFPDDLTQHSFFYLDVTFVSDSEATKRAEIVIESSDPATPEHVISVRGNSPTACLQTSGDLDFGMLAHNEESTETVTVFNCSMTTDLNISDFEIADDADSTFELIDAPEDTLSLAPLATADLTVQATLRSNQEVVGMLRFSSDDPEATAVHQQLRVAPLPE